MVSEVSWMVHITSDSCSVRFWPSSHLVILLALASSTTVHQTKSQEPFVLGNCHRYEMNVENLALGLMKLEESSRHMLLVKFGDLSKDLQLLGSTFFGRLASWVGYSINFKLASSVSIPGLLNTPRYLVIHLAQHFHGSASMHALP